ncbi:unnamed protein product, partial [Schistocephalus solidus]|uniref:Hypoxia up-regulated protein 1 n=1 Tax=Schistocephalus solidus TaxID=70667 RepID=A0A183S755_SCHSO
AKRDPLTAFADLPSIVGKKLDHPAVKKYQERYPYHNLNYNSSNGLLTFSIDDQHFTAEELLGMFFEYLKNTAVKFSGAPMNTAVITVPSYFTQSDRLAILRVAELAGIEVLQLMNSNSAVGVNYGVFRRNSFDANPQNFMFFDVGYIGTTATVVSYKLAKSREGDILEENPHMFVLGVGSDPFLGTSDFIGRLLNHFVETFKASNPDLKTDVRKNPKAMAKLSVEAQRIFKILSANPEIYASVENVMQGRDFNLRVQRSELEAMCSDLVERIRKPVNTAIEASAVPLDSIQSVILFGGGTRVPMIQAALKELTGKSELGKSINSDEAAALGAVYQAAYHTPGFKVKRFVAKDINRIPVLVTFPRIPKEDETDVLNEDPFITRTLFQTANPCPQKRSITFNRLAKNMNFTIYYDEIPSDLKSYVEGSENLMNVTISGVEEAQSKFRNYSTRGVKAHFSLDHSCLLRLTEVNLLLDLINDTTEAQQGASALQSESPLAANTSWFLWNSLMQLLQIADGISSFFGGGTGEATTQDTPDGANATTSEAKFPALLPGTFFQRSFVEPLPFEVNMVDGVVPSRADMADSRKLLRELNALDEERRETERLRNSLESNIYESREKSQSEPFTKHTTASERSVLDKLVSEASEWYHEDGFTASKKELEGWIQKLAAVVAPLDQRVHNFEQLPFALTQLSESLSNADKMLGIMKAFKIPQPAEKPTTPEGSAENATVGEGDEAKQNDSTTSPLPQLLHIFSEGEVKVFEGLVNTTKIADLAADPPFTMLDVTDRVHRLAADLHFYSTKLENWRVAAERVRAEAARKAAADAATEQSTATEKEPLTTNATSIPEKNPRSNLLERRTTLVVRQIARYKVDIADLSETRFSEQGQLEVVGAGYIFFWSGRPKTEQRGVGVTFSIRKDIVGRLTCLSKGNQLSPDEPPPASSGRQFRYHHHHQHVRSPNDEL